MALEIERKFLVDESRLGPLADGQSIRQGYIGTTDLCAVRARVAGSAAWLTLKGESRGSVRTEFEYPIPPQDALQIIAELCAERVIIKTRYRRQYAGHCWEVDVFEEDNFGLIVAEVELAKASEPLQLPVWVTREVTDDPRYYNNNLATTPYCSWGEP
jgi:adenylate cyclase